MINSLSPELTVITVVRNGSQVISTCIESVLARMPAGLALTSLGRAAGSALGNLGAGIVHAKGLTGLMAVTGRIGLGLNTAVVVT